MRSLLSAAARTRPAPQVAARSITESEGNRWPCWSMRPRCRLSGSPAPLSLPPALPVGKRLSTGFAAQIARLPAPPPLLLVLAAAGPDDTGAVSETCGDWGSARAPRYRRCRTRSSPPSPGWSSVTR